MTENEEGWPLWLLALIVAALLSFLYFLAPAKAHDYSRPELKGWFMSLHNKRSVPCCDGSDAIHISDVDWESKDGHYRVRLNNVWVDVPDDAVIDEPNRDGPTLIWPFYINGELKGVRCFLPGSMS